MRVINTHLHGRVSLSFSMFPWLNKAFPFTDDPHLPMKWIDLRTITGEKTSKIKHMLIQIFYKYRHNLILVDFDEKLSSVRLIFCLVRRQEHPTNKWYDPFSIHYASQSVHFTDCSTFFKLIWCPWNGRILTSKVTASDQSNRSLSGQSVIVRFD
jgi:hypothetical protein